MLGFICKLFFSETIYLESNERLIDWEYPDEDSNSEQTSKNKVNNFQWKWVLIFIAIVIGYDLLLHYIPDATTQVYIPSIQEITQYYQNLQGEGAIGYTLEELAGGHQWIRYLFYFERTAQLEAINHGLVDGTFDYANFVRNYVNARMNQLPSDVKPDFL